MPSKMIWTPYNGGSQTGSCNSTHKKAKPCTSPTNVTSSNPPTPYTTTTTKQPNNQHSQTPRYPHPRHPKLEHSHQQDCTESKHNFSLPPPKHSHMPTQNQTPSLHNTSTSHLRICQHHLGPTYSLQHPKTWNSTTPLSQTPHAQLQLTCQRHNHAPAPTPTYTTTTPPALQNHHAIQNYTPTSQHSNCHLHHTIHSEYSTLHPALCPHTCIQNIFLPQHHQHMEQPVITNSTTIQQLRQALQSTPTSGRRHAQPGLSGHLKLTSIIYTLCTAK